MKSVQIRSFFWSAFSYIWTEYRKSPYSVQIQENTDHKKLRIWAIFTHWILKSTFWLAAKVNENIYSTPFLFSSKFYLTSLFCTTQNVTSTMKFTEEIVIQEYLRIRGSTSFDIKNQNKILFKISYFDKHKQIINIIINKSNIYL